MAVSSCLFHNHSALKINLPTCVAKHSKSIYPPKVMKTELFGMHIGSRAILMPNSRRFDPNRRRSFRLHASWLTSARLAGDAFTLGTAAVLPFYTLMIAAPNAELTKKLMKSSIPYLLLGVFYTYLFYVSWRPDTIQLVFSGKHWLPELPSIAKLFSNQMTLASAWVHLLVIDLFAARQVYHDGLENNIETRHSISLCLFICPIGIIVHALTKALTNSFRQSKTVIR